MGSVLSSFCSRMGSALIVCCNLSSDEDESRPLEPEAHQSFCPSFSVASSSTDRRSYDVFLSFRGKDTRKKFTGHLKAALDRAGVMTFMDDVELRRGEEIGSSLIKAIEESRISIPIFSVNYASSKWCLQELAKIIECKDNQKVLPIFLDVDASDVRNQRGSFSKAFRQHEKRFPKKEVQRWREALKQAGSLSGWDSIAVNGDEPKLISLVVKEVLSDLNKISFDVALHPVGIESRVEDMMKCLQLESRDVLFVGIWGLGGIGKTTIAKAVLNKISSNFDCVCFLPDIKEAASQKGIVTLQKQLLDNLLGGYKDVNIDGRGKTIIKERLRSKKVVLILDDVNDVEQLKELAGQPDWFGPGSRIIITTRDEHTLIEHQVGQIYKPEELDFNQSHQLFSKHAFCKDQPPEDYREISKKFVKTAGGLPLVLEIFGSSLFGMEIIQWEDELEKLKNIPSKKVQDRLKLSYEGLDEIEKEIFLDTACFFIGMDKDLAITIWEGCEFRAKAGITGLIHKSLVKIDDKNTLRMHDHIRDMGREIVRQENQKEPMMRSRLWMHEEVMSVLAEPTTTRSIEGVHVDFIYEIRNSKLSIEAFAMMPKLRLLRVDYARLEGEYKRLPKDLRWFSWVGCPLNYLPTTIHLPKLVALDLKYSYIRQDRNCLHQNKLVFEKLKVLNLSHCNSLIGTPNFSGLLCLETLILNRCRRLVEIDETIGHLKRLVFLDLEFCSNLWELPSSICECRCLKILLLSNCDKFGQLPENLSTMESLTKLSLESCESLSRIPDSIWRIENPVELNLCRTEVREIPGPYGPHNKIEELNASYCHSLNRLPDSIGNLRNLKRLYVDHTIIAELPESVGSLEKLEELSLSFCRKLDKLPDSMGKMRSVEYLDISHTGIVKLPEDFGMLSSLKKLKMVYCQLLQGLFPGSFSALCSLEELSAEYCSSIERLPDMSKLKRLKELNLRNCRKLADIQGLHGLEALVDLAMNRCTSIERLEDLSKLKRLKKLDLRNCEKLADIQGLHGLEALEILDMYNCKSIERLPDLSKLKRLKKLDLQNCEKLADIQGLHGLEALVVLAMNGCTSIERLEDLSKLKRLEKLDLQNCEKLADIQGLHGLEALENLDMYNCKSIDRLPDLSKLKRLKKLDLQNCEKLADIQGLHGLEALENLDMYKCKSIERLEDLSKLKRLEELDLQNCEKLADIQGLHGLEALENLDMYNCKSIERLPDLSKLKRLKKLDLQNCEKLADIQGLHGLEALVVLAMNGCTSIERLEDLSKLKRLKKLDLRYCEKLADIQGLHGLETLENLDMYNCKSIERLPDLSKLKRLKKLDLQNCEKLADIQGLHGLEALVDLAMNGCTSIERLEDLSKLKRLKKLDLRYCEKLADIQGLHGLEALENLDMCNCKSIERLPDLSKLKRLEELDLQNCEKLADIQDLHGLEALENLAMSYCTSIERLPDFSKLKRLMKLYLTNCGNLADIQGLEGLEDLQELLIWRCPSLKRLSDLSNMKRLNELVLIECDKLIEIQGLEGLEALEELRLIRCTSIEILPDLSNFKELTVLDLTGCSKLAKVELNGKWKALSELYLGGCSSALENSLEITLVPGAFECLRKLIFPGREIPHWFTPLQLSYNKMQPGHNKMEGEARLVWNPEHHKITIRRVSVCFVLANQEEEDRAYPAIEIGVDVRRDGELVISGISFFDFSVRGTDQKDRLYFYHIQEEEEDLDTHKDLWALVKVSFKTKFPVKKAGIHVAYK